MHKHADQIALKLAGIAPDFVGSSDELRFQIKREVRFAFFGELEVHQEAFLRKGPSGISASYVSTPPENSITFFSARVGNFLRPALTFETNAGEYPMCKDSAAARPFLALSHVENVVMHELSKKERLPATKRELFIGHDSRMENKLFEKRRNRLTQWMHERQLNQVDVATRSGKTRSYISLILSAGKSFGEKTARHLEKSLLMPSDYLDSDDNKRLFHVVDWERVEELDDSVYALVPRIAVQLSAGGGAVHQGEDELPPLAFRREWLAKKNITSRSNLRTCEVHGDSMEPYLTDGDTVLIDMGQTSIVDNKVYAIEHSGEVRIKRLSKTFSGGMLIRSDNSRYPDEQLTPEQAAQLRVIGVCCWRAG